MIAERGQTQVDTAGRRFLVLEDGRRYLGRPGDPGYQVISYEEYGQLVSEAEPVQLERRRTAIPTLALFGSDDPMEASELQWRLSVVIMIPIIAVLAIPLSRVNPRQGRYSRLVPGMILCFVYVLLLSGTRSAMERGSLPLSMGLWWIHGLFLLITAAAFQLDRLLELLTGFWRLPRPLAAGTHPSPGK